MKYFGTDGMRGKVPGSFLTPSFARRVGRALAQFAKTKSLGGPVHAVIGHDTRESSPALAEAIRQGLANEGGIPFSVGCVPTPAVAYAVNLLDAQLGIMVTASHNPFTDNGIKVFLANGKKLKESEEVGIEKLIDQADPECPEEHHARSDFDFKAGDAYVNYALSVLDQGSLVGWKIALDTANGAGFQTSVEVFKRLGATVYQIGDKPDGRNINENCGSEHPSALAELVRETGAQVGFAHDGDADRLLVVDEKGEVVHGDCLLGFLGLFLHRNKELQDNTLVATVHSNSGLDRSLRQHGVKVIRVPVGDRHIASKLQESDLSFGGESSGHLIFTDFMQTGDGLQTALKVIQVMMTTRKPISELAAEIQLFPQFTGGILVKEKTPLEDLPEIQSQLERLSAILGEEGRILVRYSGTEPKLRLLVEASSFDLAKEVYSDLEEGLMTALKS